MLREIISTVRFFYSHSLLSKDRLGALMRFARWQIGARILGKRVVVPWVEKSQFIVGIGETGLTGNLYGGFMEPEDMLFLLHALRPTDVFVDVGANVGAYTILSSKVVGSKSISFEPLPATIGRLNDQINLNAIVELVEVRNRGVGREPGRLRFTNNRDTVNKVSIAGDACDTTAVDVVTLDGELEYGPSYFFKIDVEGFEYPVIEGGQNILGSAEAYALIIELNGSGEEFGYSDDDIHRKIVELGFSPVSYDPLARKLVRLDSYMGRKGNTIYIKNFEEMSQRCQEAPLRTVHTADGLLI